MDALRRLASRPRHVRHGPMMRLRARHPTRNRVYTPHSPRVWRILESFRKKQTNPGRLGAAPGESSETGGNQVLGASGACEGLPADGAELGGAARGCGPWALGAASPGGPTASYVRRGEEAQDSEGRPQVGKRSGGRARARPPPRRGARPATLDSGPGPVFEFARKRSFWTAPVMSHV
jgi:hypothetical protein